MGQYDSTVPVQPIPGNPGYDRDQAMTAPGTVAPKSTELPGTPTTVTSPMGRPTATESVDQWDTAVPAQESLFRDPGRELISGVDLSQGTGAGDGRVWAPRGPGAGDHA